MSKLNQLNWQWLVDRNGVISPLDDASCIAINRHDFDLFLNPNLVKMIVFPTRQFQKSLGAAKATCFSIKMDTYIIYSRQSSTRDTKERKKIDSLKLKGRGQYRIA